MILYFADRQMQMLGMAATSLPSGYVITEDQKTEDIETGVATFSCWIGFDKETRSKLEAMTTAGNYLLRSHEDEREFYTIIDAEINTKTQEIYIYAEDAGLDLINEIAPAFEAPEAYNAAWYVKKYIKDSGFVIGINEIPTNTKLKLSWDGEETVTGRLASIATQFGGYEISYTFDIKGLEITNKYVNIFEKRGKDNGKQLRLNKELDRIIISKSVANLATAFICEGGTIEQSNNVLESAVGGGVEYAVDLKASSRTKNTVEIIATVKAALTKEDAALGKGYGLKASIYIGGSWHSVTIKANDDEWSGTVSHITDFSFTVSGVAAGVVTFSGIKFKAERTDTGTAGVLASTACGNFIVPNYISGGENGEDMSARPITLEGYTYDDGDFYVGTDGILRSRKAVNKWSRYAWKKEPNQLEGFAGHILRPYSYDTESQSELCSHAIAELKKVCDMEINFEIDVNRLPEGVKIGDRINIIDDAGELYVSSRLLMLESSIVKDEYKATLGEHLIKQGGISQKVAALAEQFAKMAKSASRALALANAAKSDVVAATSQANKAKVESESARKTAETAQEFAIIAQDASEAAQTKAEEAQAAVGVVQESVSGLESTVAEARAVAYQANDNASIAEEKAILAEAAANDAYIAAQQTANDVIQAQQTANNAVSQAGAAIVEAGDAKAAAIAASAEAAAAKADAEQAERDLASLAETLETEISTISAEFARKTDLTETKADLQAQIKRNAGLLESTITSRAIIDETGNDAATLAEQALAKANKAKELADEASVNAQETQELANRATQAATTAQAAADAAQTAANEAQSVLDQSRAALKKAEEDLAAISGRADATEAEIAAAQKAVTDAQAAVNTALTNAQNAINDAKAAQTAAAASLKTATEAQEVADLALLKAKDAQAYADELQDAYEAQKTADDAVQSATEAQATANAAVANAATAQASADEAAQIADSAQRQAEDAAALSSQAQSDLNTAKQNLAAVTSRVDATEEEIEAAQAAVDAAQDAADKAKEDALTAKNAADQATDNAAIAQNLANAAQTAASDAQAAALLAQAWAGTAQEDVNALAVRVIAAETAIQQTTEAITLLATKAEVSQTLGGYYTKTETDAAIKVSSDSVTSTVSLSIEEMQIGARNLFPDTDFDGESKRHEKIEGGTTEGGFHFIPTVQIESGVKYTMSAKIRGNANINLYEICEGGNKAHFWIGRASLSETDYKRFTKTFIVDEGKVFTDAYICTQWGAENTLDGDWFEIEQKSLKLEKGSKATDWTPAPEDVADDIGSVESKADNAAGRVTEAETLIQQLADSISALVRGEGGGTLIRQDENGLYFFDISEIEKSLSNNANGLNDLEGIVTDANGKIDVLQSTAAALQARTEYVKSYVDENGQPCIELGEGDSSFKLRITNTEIQFAEGSDVPARINRKMLIIEKAMIKNELQFGDDTEEGTTGVWLWKRRSNGNLGLMWKEIT